jgi:hypothetical protein
MVMDDDPQRQTKRPRTLLNTVSFIAKDVIRDNRRVEVREVPEVSHLQKRKTKATVFWDCQGLLLHEFLPSKINISSNKYCKTLKKIAQSH